MSLLNFIIPATCHICGEMLSASQKFICPHCFLNLPRTLYHTRHMNPMEHKLAGLINFQRASGHFFYSPDSNMSTLVQDFKYRHFPSLARELGRITAKELLYSDFFNNIDAIIPVPIHWTKKAIRGYNQSELIARGLSDITNIPVVTNLYASRPHRTQTRLNPQQRKDNIKGIFKLKHPEEITGMHLLLIDDVCTTGATLAAAAETILYAAPSSKISILSLATTF